jgi:hypothetical protein
MLTFPTVKIIINGEQVDCDVIDLGHADNIVVITCPQVDAQAEEIDTLRDHNEALRDTLFGLVKTYGGVGGFIWTNAKKILEMTGGKP